MLLGAYSNQLQVILWIILADLLHCAPCLHGKMRHQRRILDRYIVFKGASDGDAVCVDYYHTKNAFVRADPLQGLLDHRDVSHIDLSSVHRAFSGARLRFVVQPSLTGGAKICKVAGVIVLHLPFLH